MKTISAPFQRRLGLASWLIGIAALAIAAISFQMQVPFALGIIVPALLGMLLLTLVVLTVRDWHVIARRAVRCNYQLCPNCRYDMRGHAGATTCPECGEAYNQYFARRAWLKLARYVFTWFGFRFRNGRQHRM